MSVIPSWVPTPSRLTGLAWAGKIALAAGGLPDIALYFKGGLGDYIMCSVVARELKKRGTKTVWQLTQYPELYEGNSDLVAVPLDFRLQRLCGLFGIPCVDLDYPATPPRHLTVLMCQAAGIRGTVELHPRIVLTEDEKRAGRLTPRPQIAIQSSCLAARYPMLNKQWPVERFQLVVDALKPDFDFVQLGLPTDPELRGTLDLRGKATLRQSAAVLSQCRLFVGMASGLMHLARAVECRSVIVYGGREDPAYSGYAANENLNWTGPCAPCWQRSECDFDRRCMSDILPDHVIAAVRRQDARYGTPLFVDQAEI